MVTATTKIERVLGDLGETISNVNKKTWSVWIAFSILIKHVTFIYKVFNCLKSRVPTDLINDLWCLVMKP